MIDNIKRFILKGDKKMDDIKNKVRAFMSRFFKKVELGDDEDIFSMGYVNSLFAMQLVMFIEKEFAIRVENSDLDMNNFKTINSITAFINQKFVLKS